MALSGDMQFASTSIHVHWTNSIMCLCVYVLVWHLAGGCSRSRGGATNCAKSLSELVVYRIAW